MMKDAHHMSVQVHDCIEDKIPRAIYQSHVERLNHAFNRECFRTRRGEEIEFTAGTDLCLVDIRSERIIATPFSNYCNEIESCIRFNQKGRKLQNRTGKEFLREGIFMALFRSWPLNMKADIHSRGQ